MQTKPSIVFVRGMWADGSCFSKVIPALQTEGYEVMASQHSLDTLEGDVATVTRTLGRVSAPAILVGHSYGGTLITAAGTDDRVAGLVYIAALAPDEGETSLRRAVKYGNGFFGAGSSTTKQFAEQVPIVRQALAEAERDAATFKIGKPVYIAIDDDAQRARRRIGETLQRFYLFFQLSHLEAFPVYGPPDACVRGLR